MGAPRGSDRLSTDDVTRSPLILASVGTIGVLLVAVLLALGTWQVHRLAWKIALIARVDRALHAAPEKAPGPETWASVGPNAEYRRVTATGLFLNDRETQVQALTVLGGGYWVITPLRDAEGSIVMINRGFVPLDRHDPKTRAAGQPSGPITIQGLLRLTEPGGSLLRRNDPATGRWFSRDVAAIAADRHLEHVAPYFIDADATANPGDLPVGGLTVVAFSNNHLVYAVTWYTLALSLAGGLVYAGKTQLRQIRRGSGR